MPQIGDEYPIQVTGTFGAFALVATINGPRDANGDLTIDLEYTGPRSGTINGLVITARLQNETSAEAMQRHFGGL